MSSQQSRTLSAEEIDRLSSVYLKGGRAEESWAFDFLRINGMRVEAEVSMGQVSLSGTDPAGFHLSFISAMEMLSQMTVVALHALSGLEEKSRELWIRDASARFARPVRQRSGIVLEMDIRKVRQMNTLQYCQADYRIHDATDGLYEFSVKSVLG